MHRFLNLHFYYCFKLDMIKHFGYDAEAFTVTTADGYILTINYVYSSKYVNSSLTPIILVPGMYDSSDSFCINSYSLGKYKTIALSQWLHVSKFMNEIFRNFEQKLKGKKLIKKKFTQISAAYYLADRGYKVFILNVRGNSYSLGHISSELDSRQPYGPYWAFTWHEIGIYDLPATIDEVLNRTGAKRVSFSGHSQGATTIFVLLTERPEYNLKVKFFACMAPFTFMKNIGFPINAVLELIHLYKGNRNFSFGSNTSAQRTGSLIVCSMSNDVCNNVINFIYGPSVGQRDAVS